jgi:hypothetical protein
MGRIPELKNDYTAATFLTMHSWDKCRNATSAGN